MGIKNSLDKADQFIIKTLKASIKSLSTYEIVVAKKLEFLDQLLISTATSC